MKILRMLFVIILVQLSVVPAAAQQEGQIVRLARLVIDPAQLETYKLLLKEGIETALREEPGVLTLYAVSEKEAPTHFTILEIYANAEAYQSHIKTPHFQKYKTGTAQMVQSLELIDAVPLVPQLKLRQGGKEKKKMR